MNGETMVGRDGEKEYGKRNYARFKWGDNGRKSYWNKKIMKKTDGSKIQMG